MARNPEHTRIVKIDTPRNARKSVRKLRTKFNKTNNEHKKIQIMRSANIAANSAQEKLQRTNLSAQERAQFRKIEKIYREFYNQLQRKLGPITGMTTEGLNPGRPQITSPSQRLTSSRGQKFLDNLGSQGGKILDDIGKKLKTDRKDQKPI